MRLAPLSLFLAAVLFSACDTGPGSSLYDPDRPSLPDPVVSNVASDDPIVLAGIDVITIEGSNFSPEISQNLVYFEDGAGGFARGEVLEASATRLRVKAPNFPGATLNLRVSVVGAENYSQDRTFALTAATVVYGELAQASREEAVAITRNASGDLIAALSRGGDPQGIFTLDENDGTRTLLAEAARPWTDLALADDGSLYGVLSNRAVYSIGPTGPGTVFAAVPTSDTPPAFTVIASGDNGELWAAGAEPVTQTLTRLYRFANGAFQAFTPEAGGAPFVGVVRDMVVNDGALYVASETASMSRVLRFAINADGSLSAGTVVFTSPQGTVTAIAFAADGTLFIGTSNRTDPIYQIAPGGAPSILYPGVIVGPVRAFAWSSTTSLYYTTPVIPPVTAEGAPTPAQLYTLETRRQGAP